MKETVMGLKNPPSLHPPEKQYNPLMSLVAMAYVSMLDKIHDPAKPWQTRIRMQNNAARVLLGSLGEQLTAADLPNFISISWLRNHFGNLVFIVNNGREYRLPDGIITDNERCWQSVVEVKTINPETIAYLGQKICQKPKETFKLLNNKGLFIPGEIAGQSRVARTHIQLPSFRLCLPAGKAKNWFAEAAAIVGAESCPEPKYFLVLPADSAQAMLQYCDPPSLGIDRIVPLSYSYREISTLAYLWLSNPHHDAYRQNREQERIKHLLTPPVNRNHL